MLNQDEINKTLQIKYGSLELSRYYIRGIRTALTSIRNGIELNNFAIAAKEVGVLNEKLSALEKLYNMEEAREQLTHLDNQKK